MTPERPKQSEATGWIIGAFAGVVILLLGFSIRSLVMIFVEPQQAGVVRPESAKAEEMQDVKAKNEEPGTKKTEQEAGSITAQLPAPATPVQAPQKASEFAVDYQTLREREAGRNEMTKTLREIAKENPESGYAMTEEQLRKFEQSGGSFQ
ncbi:MAG: hypothetical protein KKC28_14125 [Verrucomicrobia bacterium]|nr:hypothetical protein [Verrucomicrobiota bacterium]MBU1858114.1 hypothetical protein [Verrucomicrobiota bacterium]